MIYITGDIHADLESRYNIFKTFTKDDILIVLGDFGFSWGAVSEKRWNNCKWPFTTLAVDGNHENFIRIYNLYKKTTIFGGQAYQLNKNTFYLKRGEVFNVNGKTFMAIGGAASIDKEYRIPNISWWKEELLSAEEIEACNNKIEEIKEVDYVITHTCPKKFSDRVFQYIDTINDPVEKFLDIVDEKLKYKHWFFGHHHKFVATNKFTGLYEEVYCLDTNNFIKD